MYPQTLTHMCILIGDATSPVCWFRSNPFTKMGSVNLAIFAPWVVRRLIKNSGITRVNKEATLLLGRILEDVGEQICKEAKMPMLISKRVTLLPNDVEIGAKKVINHSREMNLTKRLYSKRQ